MRSPSRTVLGVGAGLAAAGVGAALGLAAERWTAGRVQGEAGGESYGSLRGTTQRVSADDGTALHVEVDELDVDGPPDAEQTSPVTVVFSHGFCLNQDIWHYQRQWLRGRYRMVFWDQRGHGRSATGPEQNYTVDQCGADLRAVIDAVASTGPLVLVGHSMGGMTVMALAGEYPDLIRDRVVGAALLATSSGGLADVHWGLTGSVGRVAHRIAPVAMVGLTRAPRLVDRTRRIGSDFEQLLVKRYSYASPVPSELVRFTAAMIAATPIDVVSGFLPGFDVHDKGEALAALDGIESLVLSGEDDLLTPPEHSEAIVRRMPGAEHVLVPESGHMVMLEHPDVVNLHLGDLLDRADRAVVRAQGRGGRRPRLRRPRRA
ncbi:alpha/beta fold hydrolase [Angustibacter sp. McL0619]|uniref:alpha/beta fold hydrolase n=1 Tax=Angustibacter sp. McL0619 TaxID=3415676 RepID=UPI003CF6890F